MIRYLLRRSVFLFSVVASLVVPGVALGNFIEFAVGGDTTTASIQATVDAFRAAAGAPNNGNAPGTVGGRREINWDGGSTNNFTVATAGTPFTGFLDTRGAQFTTPGTGFVQAPPAELDPLVFGVFSLQRIFSPDWEQHNRRVLLYSRHERFSSRPRSVVSERYLPMLIG